MVLGNLAAVGHAAAVVLPGPAFDPALTLRAVHEERCTLYGVPTMFVSELEHPDFASYDLSGGAQQMLATDGPSWQTRRC